MAVTRREFLERSALGIAAAGAVPVWLGARSAAAKTANSPLLVVIFLRGAADGLSLVPPIGDPDYARQRGALAITEPLPFAKGFGLHPALAPLTPLVQRGQLAVVHAAGSPHASRSHFEAQDFMEMGSVGPRRLRTGWLARGLDDGLDDGPAEPALFSKVALSLRAPVSLRGGDALALPRPQSFGIGGASRAARAQLERLYATGDDPVAQAGRKAFRAVHQLRNAVGTRRLKRSKGRGGFVRLVDGLTTLDAAGLGMRACFLELDGWDTHASQGADEGKLARSAGSLAGGIARLFERIGEQRDALVVVMTEFGRTAQPNGSGGTDHGHGSVMLLAGPRVRGGVHGDWPGLSSAKLWEERDLAVTTDYRDVLWETLGAHLGQAPPAATFPDFRPRPMGLIG